ncbi:hypothetical protein, partial [Salmonella enterica]|uniref:hypothetical protein n=1 Tax=Salmonella enterica TaxID=28901 RepID=UPI003D165A5B
ATQGAVAGHPSDGEDIKNSKSALEGHVSLVSREGHFRHSVAAYITQEVRGWQPTLGTLAHLVFPFSFSIFPRFLEG